MAFPVCCFAGALHWQAFLWPKFMLHGIPVWYRCDCGAVQRNDSRKPHCGHNNVVTAVGMVCVDERCASKTDVWPDGTHCGLPARHLDLMCELCGHKCDRSGMHCGRVGRAQRAVRVPLNRPAEGGSPGE